MRLFIGRTGWPLWLTLIWTLSASAAHAQSAPLPVAEFWGLAAATRDAVSGGEELTGWAQRWQAVNAIAWPDGQVTMVDGHYWADLLAASEPDRETLAQQFAALSAASQEWPTPAMAPEALTRLERLLANSAYDYRDKPPTLWERLRQAVLRALSRSLGGVSGDLAQIALLGLGAAVLGLVVYYLWRAVAADLSAETHLARADDGDQKLTAAQAWQKAQFLGQANDYRNAVRYLYLSTLLRLDEQGWLRYDRSRTNHEMVMRLMTTRREGSAEIALLLREVVDVFDAVWYGFHPIQAADFQHYAGRVAQLQATEPD